MIATLGSCLTSEEVIRACHVLDCLGIPQVKIASHKVIIRDKYETPTSSLVVVSSGDMQAANRFRRRVLKELTQLSRESKLMDRLVILGIEYLEHCFSCGKGIPDMVDPGCRMHLTSTLYGWNVAYATDANSDKEIEDVCMMVNAMGGDYQNEIEEKTRVIILSPSILTAENMEKSILGTRLMNCVNGDAEISVVNLSWLQSCWKLRTLQKPWDHRFRLLDGHTICSTGQGPNGKQTLKRAAEICGATWSDHLDTTCTVLIATNAHGDKFEYAQRKRIPVVKERWLWDCIKFFCVKRLDHEEYKPDSNRNDEFIVAVTSQYIDTADNKSAALAFDRNKRPVRSNMKGSRSLLNVQASSLLLNEWPTKCKLSVRWADNLESVHSFSEDPLDGQTTEDPLAKIETSDVMGSYDADSSTKIADKELKSARSKCEVNNAVQNNNHKHTSTVDNKVLSRRNRGAFLAQICGQNEVRSDMRTSVAADVTVAENLNDGNRKSESEREPSAVCQSAGERRALQEEVVDDPPKFTCDDRDDENAPSSIAMKDEMSEELHLDVDGHDVEYRADDSRGKPFSGVESSHPSHHKCRSQSRDSEFAARRMESAFAICRKRDVTATIKIAELDVKLPGPSNPERHKVRQHEAKEQDSILEISKAEDGVGQLGDDMASSTPSKDEGSVGEGGMNQEAEVVATTAGGRQDKEDTVNEQALEEGATTAGEASCDGQADEEDVREEVSSPPKRSKRRSYRGRSSAYTRSRRGANQPKEDAEACVDLTGSCSDIPETAEDGVGQLGDDMASSTPSKDEGSVGEGGMNQEAEVVATAVAVAAKEDVMQLGQEQEGATMAGYGAEELVRSDGQESEERGGMADTAESEDGTTTAGVGAGQEVENAEEGKEEGERMLEQEAAPEEATGIGEGLEELTQEGQVVEEGGSMAEEGAGQRADDAAAEEMSSPQKRFKSCSYAMAIISQDSAGGSAVPPGPASASAVGSLKASKGTSRKAPAKPARANYVLLNTQVIGFEMFQPLHGRKPRTSVAQPTQLQPLTSTLTSNSTQPSSSGGLNVPTAAQPAVKKRRRARRTPQLPSLAEPLEEKVTPVGSRYQTCATPDSITPEFHLATNALRQLDFPDGISGVAMKLQFPEMSPGMPNSRQPLLSSTPQRGLGGMCDMSGSFAGPAAHTRDAHGIQTLAQPSLTLQPSLSSSMASQPLYPPQSAFPAQSPFSAQAPVPPQNSFSAQPTFSSHSSFGCQSDLSAQSFFPTQAGFPAQQGFAGSSTPFQAQHQPTFATSNTVFQPHNPFPALSQSALATPVNKPFTFQPAAAEFISSQDLVSPLAQSDFNLQQGHSYGFPSYPGSLMASQQMPYGSFAAAPPVASQDWSHGGGMTSWGQSMDAFRQGGVQQQPSCVNGSSIGFLRREPMGWG
ncbi:hypothetical protein GUITHDRAFT_146493 [Guillardia theta CCMP2712]|uniref:BRCT domain-containing protein n=1 Tax=Guillardia theta (strain CCMP2712) TaxID=905079 RepID=L1IH29_GUITC|nr:hypothetical protein GUITHDRAFT_146493 [Guillardia theta CCMP2712]EKX35377.1 hypothetical protein GUITHDRAFT_146493 [Guillardia theta CCMP2712]|eukprot:XP_005822357.1 hypothetical protein GUITHDRAFT_146493 [Guillardia theta CCMP2712]